MTELVEPAPAIAAILPYAPTRALGPIDVDLAGTESGDGGVLARYPDAAPLQGRLASALGVPADQVLVTAGADDALDRIFRAMLCPGREVILTTPTFEMLPRYARLSGAKLVEVPWECGALPVDALIGAITPSTSLIVIVSPNNPTGAVADFEDLRALAEAAPTALLAVDLAYVEFADVDPTRALLRLPNAVVTRTFSKAWGLPGIRVGWVAGPAPIVGWFRKAGNPYAVAAPSLALAMAAESSATDERDERIEALRASRDRLYRCLTTLGLEPLPSQANFICVRALSWFRDALAGLGIAVRHFRHADGERVRITCPVEPALTRRVERAIRTVRAPEALLFDMDGVIADVSRSYRTAIIDTAAHFGVEVTAADVQAMKARGNANDDWQLTTDLLAARGREVLLAEVTAEFERRYQGESGRPGLRELEKSLVSNAWLAAAAARYSLGIVTGRPRRDAEHFLARFGLAEHFRCCVTMEDGPSKPNPAVVLVALRRLRVSHAWLIGDTPDDIRAARAAEVLPIGIVAHQDGIDTLRDALLVAGAARVLDNLNDLMELLP